ncbi:unnamed protein product, partial [Darwinula stevensoni]
DDLIVTEPVTEASIIADIKDRSQESEPGDKSDGEQEATYNALPPSLSYANDALAIVRKFLISRGEVPVDLFEAVGKLEDFHFSIASSFTKQMKITDYMSEQKKCLNCEKFRSLGELQSSKRIRDIDIRENIKVNMGAKEEMSLEFAAAEYVKLHYEEWDTRAYSLPEGYMLMLSENKLNDLRKKNFQEDLGMPLDYLSVAMVFNRLKDLFQNVPSLTLADYAFKDTFFRGFPTSHVKLAGFAALPMLSKLSLEKVIPCKDCMARILTEDDLENPMSFSSFLAVNGISLKDWDQSHKSPVMETYKEIFKLYVCAASTMVIPRNPIQLLSKSDEQMEKTLLILTREQKQLVDSPERVILMTGVSGTGKTVVLKRRALHCAKDGAKLLVINIAGGFLTEEFRRYLKGEFLRQSSPCVALQGQSPENVQLPSDQMQGGPSHPQYATKEARKKTFDSWPENMSQSPEQMADAGFFYIGHVSGVLDHVRCFYCSVGVLNWEPNDDPMSEHRRWSRPCPYINPKDKESTSDTHQAPSKEPILPSQEASSFLRSFEHQSSDPEAEEVLEYLRTLATLCSNVGKDPEPAMQNVSQLLNSRPPFHRNQIKKVLVPSPKSEMEKHQSPRDSKTPLGDAEKGYPGKGQEETREIGFHAPDASEAKDDSLKTQAKKCGKGSGRTVQDEIGEIGFHDPDGSKEHMQKDASPKTQGKERGKGKGRPPGAGQEETREIGFHAPDASEAKDDSLKTQAKKCGKGKKKRMDQPGVESRRKHQDKMESFGRNEPGRRETNAALTQENIEVVDGREEGLEEDLRRLKNFLEKHGKGKHILIDEVPITLGFGSIITPEALSHHWQWIKDVEARLIATTEENKVIMIEEEEKITGKFSRVVREIKEWEFDESKVNDAKLSETLGRAWQEYKVNRVDELCEYDFPMQPYPEMHWNGENGDMDKDVDKDADETVEKEVDEDVDRMLGSWLCGIFGYPASGKSRRVDRLIAKVAGRVTGSTEKVTGEILVYNFGSKLYRHVLEQRWKAKSNVKIIPMNFSDFHNNILKLAARRKKADWTKKDEGDFRVMFSMFGDKDGISLHGSQLACLKEVQKSIRKFVLDHKYFSSMYSEYNPKMENRQMREEEGEKNMDGVEEAEEKFDGKEVEEVKPMKWVDNLFDMLGVMDEENIFFYESQLASLKEAQKANRNCLVLRSLSNQSSDTAVVVEEAQRVKKKVEKEANGMQEAEEKIDVWEKNGKMVEGKEERQKSTDNPLIVVLEDCPYIYDFTAESVALLKKLEMKLVFVFKPHSGYDLKVGVYEYIKKLEETEDCAAIVLQSQSPCPAFMEHIRKNETSVPLNLEAKTLSISGLINAIVPGPSVFWINIANRECPGQHWGYVCKRSSTCGKTSKILSVNILDQLLQSDFCEHKNEVPLVLVSDEYLLLNMQERIKKILPNTLVMHPKDFRGCEASIVVSFNVNDEWLLEVISRSRNLLIIIDNLPDHKHLWQEMEKEGQVKSYPCCCDREEDDIGILLRLDDQEMFLEQENEGNQLKLRKQQVRLRSRQEFFTCGVAAPYCPTWDQIGYRFGMTALNRKGLLDENTGIILSISAETWKAIAGNLSPSSSSPFNDWGYGWLGLLGEVPELHEEKKKKILENLRKMGVEWEDEDNPPVPLRMGDMKASSGILASLSLSISGSLLHLPILQDLRSSPSHPREFQNHHKIPEYRPYRQVHERNVLRQLDQDRQYRQKERNRPEKTPWMVKDKFPPVYQDHQIPDSVKKIYFHGRVDVHWDLHTVPLLWALDRHLMYLHPLSPGELLKRAWW